MTGLGGKHVVTSGMAWHPVSNQMQHSEGKVTIGSLTDYVMGRGESKNWMLRQLASKKLSKHPVSPKGFLQVYIFAC